MPADIGIVIVNWNTCDQLEACLHTVFASTGITYRVVVVDNASPDDSPAMVRAKFPQATLLALDENTGYPRGNNIGLKALGYHGKGHVDAEAPRYALLLNPDTELPPDAFARMVAFMDAHPEIGAAGPKLVMENGELDKACRRGFPSPTVSFYHYSGLAKLFPKSERFGRYHMSFADPNDSIEVDSVVGAYMQVRREAVAAVGLMDETFFMYAEDIDWAYRIKEADWKVWYYPAVVVKHLKRTASNKNPRAQFEFWRAMLIFYRKYYRMQTPLWLHSLILTALVVKGGRGLWQEIRHPSPSSMSL